MNDLCVIFCSLDILLVIVFTNLVMVIVN